ncbi:MAG: FlgD immunoglobulin-like domain containing protein [bacterium]
MNRYLLLVIINFTLIINTFALNISHFDQEKFLFQDEFLIDKNFICRPAISVQVSPKVASDGINYFIMWEDWRNGTSDIYGTRMTPEGVILDSIGIPISVATRYQSSPAVVFGDSGYFVVWDDSRAGGSSGIYGARVNQDGIILDTNGIPIAPVPSYTPAAGFDGTNYFVVWVDERSGYNNRDIYGSRVTQDGVVLDPGGIPISVAENQQSKPAISFDGTNYLVVWWDERNGESDIFGTRVSPNGIVLEPAGIPISTAPNHQLFADVIYGGSSYLVVWADMRNGVDYDIYGTRITTDGIVLDSSGIAISTAINNQCRPAVSFDGINYLVTWEDSRSDTLNYHYEIYGARINQNGSVLDPEGIRISLFQAHKEKNAIAFNGTHYIVIWEDYRNDNSSPDIYGTRVNPSGVILDSTGILISSGVYFYDQHTPAVDFNGLNYLVVWEDERHEPANSDIYGARIEQAGNVLDPEGIPISIAVNIQRHPAIAHDINNHFAVWQDMRNGVDYDIYGARITYNGLILDSAGIVISTATNHQEYPSVAFDGTNYLVVWQDKRNGADYNIYGARINQAGVVLDSIGISIANAPGYQVYPEVAFGGTNYFVVWEDYRNNKSEIYGCRISQDGVVLDPEGLIICNSLNYCCNPAIAFDGNNYLVVWEEACSGTYWDILGCRVNQSGVVIDSIPIVISSAPSSQWYPALTFDGLKYNVVWQDSRNGLSWDIYGAKVTTGGTATEPFNVSIQSGNQIFPAVISGGDSVLIVYSGFCDSIGGFPANVMRIWGRFILRTGIDDYTDQTAKNIHITLYPNPFSNCLKIGIRAGKYGRYSLEVYNILGQKIKTIFNGEKQAGYYEVVWDGKDDLNRQMPAGVYFLTYQMGTIKTTAKVVMVR